MHIAVSDAVGAEFIKLKTCESELFPEKDVTNDSVLSSLMQNSPFKQAAEELAQKKKQAVDEIHKKNHFKK